MTDASPTKQPDTPIAAPTTPPPSTLDEIKGFVGDLARPFAIIVTSASASTATVIIALNNKDGFSAAAIFIGAVFTGVVGLFGAKAWENAQQAKQTANVAVAQAQSTTP